MNTKNPKITLLGYPNAGKTSVFNTLTKSNNKTGNFSGVTVNIASSKAKIGNQEFIINDIPGINSLTSFSDSKDELVVRDYITKNPNDIYINIVDVSQLKKHLLLTLTAIDNKINTVLVVNMIDTTTLKQQEILDVEKYLSSKLNISVVCISAKKKIGFEKLINIITQLSDKLKKEPVIQDRIKFKTDIISYVTKSKEICAELNVKTKSNIVTQYLDKIFLNKIISIPLFFAVIYAILFITMNIHIVFSGLIDSLSGLLLIDGFRSILEKIHTPEILTIILANGIGSGIQTMLTFIPIIFTLFFLISFLEESGYMSRQAFIADGIMQKLGLPGKAFISLILGLGCTAACSSGCRTLEKDTDRKLTLMISPSISCSAKLPIYIFFCYISFPKSYAIDIVFLLYVIGIIFTIFNGMFLSNSLLQNNTVPFIMELPNYKFPQLKVILKNSVRKLKNFILGIGKIIIPVIALLTILNTVNFQGKISNNLQDSILATTSKSITPILKPIGINENNWEATLSLITGFLAKEILVATLNSVYFSEVETQDTDSSFIDNLKSIFTDFLDQFVNRTHTDIFDMESSYSSIGDNIQQKHDIFYKKFQDGAGIFAFLLFVLIYTPCISAMGAITREVGRLWALSIGSWSLFNAYIISMNFYQITHKPLIVSLGILVSSIFGYIILFFTFKYINKKHINSQNSNFYWVKKSNKQ